MLWELCRNREGERPGKLLGSVFEGYRPPCKKLGTEAVGRFKAGVNGPCRVAFDFRGLEAINHYWHQVSGEVVQLT